MNLKDTALKFSGKREITELSSIPVDVEVKEGSFERNGQKATYNYIELNGWKYSIKGSLMSRIKQIMSVRPTTKNIKIEKDDKGELFVVPLD